MGEPAEDQSAPSENSDKKSDSIGIWKYLNLYLVFSALLSAFLVLAITAEKSENEPIGVLLFFWSTLVLCYLFSIGTFDTPRAQKIFEKCGGVVGELTKSLIDLTVKILGWGFLLILFGGIGYLFFGILGSLSVSTLLIIIIIILVLK